MSKLKRLPTSSEKDQRIFNKEYNFPVVFRAKGKLHKINAHIPNNIRQWDATDLLSTVLN